MSSADLQARVAATVAALGDVPAVDAHLDPRGAARFSRGKGPFWLRALPEPQRGAVEDGYGPAPGAPQWLRVEPGHAEVTALAEGAKAEAPLGPRTASAVDVRVETATWGTSAAPFTKVIARAAIVTVDGARLEIAAAVADDEVAARAGVRAVASALAGALGVPLQGATDAPPAEGEDPLAATAPDLEEPRGAPLARFTLGWEGDRLVLRDLASRGPREGSWIWTSVVAASLVGAVVASGVLAMAVRGGAPWTSIALRAGIVAVFALGAFAFFHVARHAIRYRAEGAPIGVFADDRVVIAPWVRRDGAIDPRPEGRFGAGVRAAEVHRVHVEPRDGRHAVSLDTAHGPIDVASLDDPAEAAILRAVVERALGGVASPNRRKTSLMRGRERATAPG